MAKQLKPISRRSFLKALGALAIVVMVPVRGISGWINVKLFGAVGDGITDDSRAIKAAMAEAMRTGKTVYFPKGRYRL